LLPFRVPDALHFATVDAATGRPATTGRVVLEAFKPGQEPDMASEGAAAGAGAPMRVAPGPAGAGRALPSAIPVPATGGTASPSGIY
jgi:hypothetical protein